MRAGPDGIGGELAVVRRGGPGSTLIIDGPVTAYACDIRVHSTAMDILVRTTATFTPSAGVIIVVPGRRLSITSQYGGGHGSIEVPATSSLRIGPDLGVDPTARSQIQSLRCDGQADVLNPLVGDVRGAGRVSLNNLGGEPAHLQSISGPVAVSLTGSGNSTMNVGGSTTPFVVPAGAALTLGPGFLRFQHDVEVLGALELRPGAELLGYGTTFRFAVRPMGSLRLFGTAAQPAKIWGYDWRYGSTVIAPVQTVVQGNLDARHFWVRGLGGGGIRCEPDSNLGGAAGRIESGWLQRDWARPGPVLDMARTAATEFGPLILDGPGGSFVRATTPHAVSFAGASGSVFGSEDDALGVITWHDGQRYFGSATPGCRGAAECEANDRASLGNGTFESFADNAHPFLGGIRALGFGGRTTPLVYDFVNVWLDPALPISTLYYPSDATGRVAGRLWIPNNPIFLDAVVYAQWLLIEPQGCMPLGLSGSTALRFVVSR